MNIRPNISSTTAPVMAQPKLLLMRRLLPVTRELSFGSVIAALQCLFGINKIPDLSGSPFAAPVIASGRAEGRYIMKRSLVLRIFKATVALHNAARSNNNEAFKGLF